MSTRLVGTVAALYRYPVKSMAGERLDRAPLTWNGIDGDRGYVFTKQGNLSRFPWLTARDLPGLLRYGAYLVDRENTRKSPVLVRTPDGDELAVESDELRERLERQYDAPLHLMHLGRGAADASPVSVVGLGSVRALGERIGKDLDDRRFRQNIVFEPAGGEAFVEDGWVGRRLTFGDQEDAPQVRLVRRDPRCMMVNLDPDEAVQDPAILREIVESRENCFGLYASVEAIGPLAVGAPIYLD
jgi:uncharacterized protein